MRPFSWSRSFGQPLLARRHLLGDRRFRATQLLQVALALPEHCETLVQSFARCAETRLRLLGVAVQPGPLPLQLGEIAFAFAEQGHPLIDLRLGPIDFRLGRAQLLLQAAQVALGRGDVVLALAKHGHALAQLGIGLVDLSTQPGEIARRFALLGQRGLERRSLLGPMLLGALVGRRGVDQAAPAKQGDHQRADRKEGGTRQRHGIHENASRGVACCERRRS